MIRETANALVACVLTFVICVVAYPAVVWGLGQLVFPSQAEGSLIYDRDRTVIGSELIAQPFVSDKYFVSRPSAVDYKADATGGSNLGTKNPDLRKKVAERAEALKATTDNPAPVDLVTASGGGMDPHISPEAAYYQAARVAAARSMPVEQVKSLIARHVETSGVVIGAPARVNVLKLNLALNEEKPAPATASAPSPTATAPTATPASASAAVDGVAALRTQAATIAGQIEKLGERIDALTREHSGREQTLAGVKALDERLAKLTEETRPLPAFVQRVDGLDGRVKAADQAVQQLRTEVRQTRAALESLPATTRTAPRAR
jgi:potassium-transporting ATPase KdpC subunit